MKKILFFLISLLLMISCDNDENRSADVISTKVEFSVIDQDGNDLLNPETENAIRKQDLRVFYLVNGVKKEVYDAMMDCPRNFMIFEHVERYRLRLFPNIDEAEEFTITYIQWNEQDTDTIRAQFARGDGKDGFFVICTKAWFNEKEVGTDEHGLFYEIVK